ncbi:MAG TPA: diguanylate cyclase, partial [Thermopetrobacter sp.]|nr:diguanylate cyclase [Thermopetrobacter sp.]
MGGRMNDETRHPKKARPRPAAPSGGPRADRLEWFTRNGHDIDHWHGEPLLLGGPRAREDATIDDILAAFAPGQRGRVKKSIAACLRDGTPGDVDLTIATGPLEGAPMRFSVSREPTRDGPTPRLRCTLRLAPPDSCAGRAMIAGCIADGGVDNTLLDRLLDAVPNAIAVYDNEDRLIYFNRQYRRLYDRAAPAIRIGDRYEKILRYAVEHGQYADLDPADHRLCAFWIAKRMEMRRSGMIGALVQKLASGRWVQVHENKMQNGHTVFICTDITDLKKTETLIRKQAESDSLTGLLNRPAFFAACRSRLRQRRRGDAVGCLILIDLDMFKSINDTMGHQAGDTMLRTIAERTRATLRDEDLSARLGGDEFAAFLSLEKAEQAEQVVRKLHAALTGRLTLSGRIMYPHLSIGYVTTREEEDIDSLYHKADAALSEAKNHGRNTWQNYDLDMQKRQERENYIVQSLRESLATEAFHFKLQPLRALDGGRHVGFEVLARWRHDNGSIPPTEFIPVAENAGLIMEISRRVFIQTFEW